MVLILNCNHAFYCLIQFPLVFFCLFFLCETVTCTAVLTLLLSLYRSLALVLFPVSHFISFTCFVPGHWVLCHQIPTNPLFISLSLFSLSQVLISEHLSSSLYSHYALCQVSTRAEVCDICQHVSTRCAQNLIPSVALLQSIRAACFEYFAFIPLLKIFYIHTPTYTCYSLQSVYPAHGGFMSCFVVGCIPSHPSYHMTHATSSQTKTHSACSAHVLPAGFKT